MITEHRTAARVLVFERMDPTDESLRWLEKQGFAVTWGRPMWQEPYARHTEDEIVAAAAGHIAAMGASGARFSARVIERLPDLRYISKFGVGYETIDIEAANRRGIRVAITPEASEISDVAEHTIATILALRKRLLRWTSGYMRNGGWRPGPFASSISGSTLGLIGLGHIGCAVARRVAGWNMNVLAFDPFCQAPPADVALTDLETLLKTADVVSIHASPNAQNRHLIDEHALALMKRSAILINTARASLVDTAALCRALRANQIEGAAIDVFDEEPPNPSSELLQLDNVLVTPHAAAWTELGLRNIGWHAARNLLAMITGEGHADTVNAMAQQPRSSS